MDGKWKKVCICPYAVHYNVRSVKDVIVTLVTAVPRYDNVLLSVTFLIGPGEYRTRYFRMCMAADVITL